MRARRKLRFRLALEFTLIAGAVYLVLAVVLVTARSRYFAGQFDREVESRARMVAATLAAHPPSEETLAATVRAVGKAESDRSSIFQIRDERQALLASSIAGFELPVFAPDDAVHFDTVGGDVLGLPGASMRMVAVPGQWGQRRVWVYHAASLAPVTQSTATLRSLLVLVVLPGTVLGTGLAAWFLAGRAMRRIDAVAEALKKVKLGGAGARVDVAGSSDEIGEMVSEMNSMLARLESAFRAQERFIVNVTHELKTPVSIMLAQAQLLKGGGAEVPKGHREFVLSVEEEMRRLGALLESFLTLARAGSGQTYLESSLVGLHEVMIESIRRVAPESSAKGVSLVPIFGDVESGEEPTLRGDAELLTTALANLIRDAVEHAPPDSPIEVAIESGEAQVLIAVRWRPERDEGGSSISHARAGRRRTRELGLEVARGIAQLHGGDVWSEETEGVSRAVLRLPMAAVGAETE